jgi:hypothetical protein
MLRSAGRCPDRQPAANPGLDGKFSEQAYADFLQQQQMQRRGLSASAPGAADAATDTCAGGRRRRVPDRSSRGPMRPCC